jgi:predicted phosphoadenosine phosphosulfate sulfurtransferase
VSKLKRPIGIDVLQAAEQRIAFLFDRFPKIYVSFSGGKDSTVMLQLVVDEARRRRRKIGVLFIDLEAQYRATLEHVANCFDLYADVVDPYWICLPFNLRNAVSMFAPRWQCWDPDAREKWVRESPPQGSISDVNYFPFFRRGMEFEEFVEDFGSWYAGHVLTACLVGIRADESLNRFRTLMGRQSRYQNISWTTRKRGAVYNAYPIYDWKTQDIWVYPAKYNKPTNRIYDLMHQAGLSIHQMRICQPYGDDQRKGLWLYHILEPATWPKVVARVGGANAGSLYCQERGNVLGNHRVTKPKGYTWEEYAKFLVESLPPKAKAQFTAKIDQFISWWSKRGYEHGIIPDEADPKDEAGKKTPSWRRICRAILRNDYWCKSLSFSQTKSASYEKYLKSRRSKEHLWRAIDRNVAATRR